MQQLEQILKVLWDQRKQVPHYPLSTDKTRILLCEKMETGIMDSFKVGARKISSVRAVINIFLGISDAQM